MSTIQKNLKDLIAFRTVNGFLVTKMDDIIFCEADGNYSWVTVAGGKEVIVMENLKSILQKLPDTLFLRVHKSCAVNLLHVRRVVNKKQLDLCLSNDKTVKVACRKKQEVLALFGNMEKRA